MLLISLPSPPTAAAPAEAEEEEEEEGVVRSVLMCIRRWMMLRMRAPSVERVSVGGVCVCLCLIRAVGWWCGCVWRVHGRASPGCLDGRRRRTEEEEEKEEEEEEVEEEEEDTRHEWPIPMGS